MSINERDDDNKPIRSVKIIYILSKTWNYYIYEPTQLQLIHVDCLNNISMVENNNIKEDI